MVGKEIKQKYDLARTYLRNKQTASAHNLFLELAEKEKKNKSFLAGLFFILAAECKIQQGKDSYDEILNAGKSYLELAKAETSNPAFLNCDAISLDGVLAFLLRTSIIF